MKIGLNRWASGLRTAVPFVWAVLLGLGSAYADETTADSKEVLDVEHIFGFTEGAYIGESGEKEIENTAIESFGKTKGYSFFENETAFRYVVPDSGLRFSAGALLDGYLIQDASGLPQRDGFGLEGLTTEVRWQPLTRGESLPLDLTLSLSPQWRNIDDLTGAQASAYSADAAILADVAIVPDKFFLGFNLDCEPAVTGISGRWQNESSLQVSFAASYAIAPEVFIGAEMRHLNGSEQGLFSSHALYFGPSFYARVSETFAFKVTWSEQVPDRPGGRLDLENFERHQALLLLVKTF